MTQSRPHSRGTDERGTAIVRRLDDVVRRSGLVGASVAGLCAACKVPRRTLNLAFQNVVGMGPATYPRRVRLKRARRALQRERAHSSAVKSVALELGSGTSDVSLNSTGNCLANRRMKPYAEQTKEFVQPEPCGIDFPERRDAGRYKITTELANAEIAAPDNVWVSAEK